MKESKSPASVANMGAGLSTGFQLADTASDKTHGHASKPQHEDRVEREEEEVARRRGRRSAVCTWLAVKDTGDNS